MLLIKRIFILGVIIVVVACLFWAINYIEWYEPKIDIKLESRYAGKNPIRVSITDKGRGLKYSVIKLKNEDGEIVLERKTYIADIYKDTIEIQVNFGKHNIKDGPATIIVEAGDRSYFNFLDGNKAIASKEILIDTKPPTIEIISTEHYINHGGSGLVIYKTSDDSDESGVNIGEQYFTGYRGYFRDPDVYLCFFAFPYNEDINSNIVVYSVDEAGNSSSQSFFHRVKPVDYKQSTIGINEVFITNKMQSLVQGQLPGDLKEVFLRVNNDLRKKNDTKISEITNKTTPSINWKGKFHQLSNSQVQANFADERTYYFNDEPIDKQYHLGYDLAVTRRYPIEAANAGEVVYADNIGIYGKTVIIDHGMGIFSLYGHMSSIGVKLGDPVKKKQIIGRTGQTGLAAGDHLHYGVYIQGVPVRPIEWWDAKWIKSNIVLKILAAEQEFDKAQSN